MRANINNNIVDTLSENNSIIKQNPNITYEEAINKLQEIIQDFQKGNMQLNEAVIKYMQSQELLIICQKKLETFESALEQTEEVKQIKDDNSEISKFEDNIKILEDICEKIEKNNNIPLSELEEMYKTSNKLTTVCSKELSEFKHVIEYYKPK